MPLINVNHVFKLWAIVIKANYDKSVIVMDKLVLNDKNQKKNLNYLSGGKITYLGTRRNILICNISDWKGTPTVHFDHKWIHRLQYSDHMADIQLPPMV